MCQQLSGVKRTHDVQLFKTHNDTFPSLLHFISSDCPIYDIDGNIVPEHVDGPVEKSYNRMLAGTDKLRSNAGFRPLDHTTMESQSDLDDLQRMKFDMSRDEIESMDLHTGLKLAERTFGMQFNQQEERLINWHISNLEYGCATDIANISLVHW